MKFRRFCFGAITMAVLLMSFQMSASAEGTYNSYIYNDQNEAVPSPQGYVAEKVLYGFDLGVNSLNQPSDLFVQGNNLYILDSGNSRIIEVDQNYKLLRVIIPKNQNKQLVFGNAKGMFVDHNNNIYVADSGKQLIYIFDNNGNLKNSIGKPKSDLITSSYIFDPQQVVVDSSGIIYVCSEGSYQGALVFNQKLNFMGFFGAEQVTLDLQQIYEDLLRPFMTYDQKLHTERHVPEAFSGFTIDNEDFIYTALNPPDNAADNRDVIKKLNPLGNNILWYKQNQMQEIGDIDKYYDSKGNYIRSKINDISISPDGSINALDTSKDKIFQYDQNSNLLFVLGGAGNQKGTLAQPVAVADFDNCILVLDSKYDSITIYKPTSFCVNVHKAVTMFNQGNYAQSYDLWKEILKYDRNYTLANIGMGKALQKLGKYGESLNYFKLANNKTDFSDCYSLYRSEILNKYFTPIAIILALLIIVLFILHKARKKKKIRDYDIKFTKSKYVFYTILHPFKGFGYLKDEKKGSLLYANMIVLLFFIAEIISRQNTGYLFNPNRVEDFNIVVVVIMTIGLFVLWVASNWAICTLFNGEGSFKEIWIFSAYALLPIVLLTIPVVLLSNYFTLDEQSFYGFCMIIMYGWTAICLFMAIKEVQQYTFKQTVGAIIATLVGICVLVVIVSIVYSIIAQFITFISDLYGEAFLRS